MLYSAKPMHTTVWLQHDSYSTYLTWHFLMIRLEILCRLTFPIACIYLYCEKRVVLYNMPSVLPTYERQRITYLFLKSRPCFKQKQFFTHKRLAILDSIASFSTMWLCAQSSENNDKHIYSNTLPNNCINGTFLQYNTHCKYVIDLCALVKME